MPKKEKKFKIKNKKKFKVVMKEYGEGKLKSSSGEKVTDVSQARAIAKSESDKACKKKKKKRG